MRVVSFAIVLLAAAPVLGQVRADEPLEQGWTVGAYIEKKCGEAAAAPNQAALDAVLHEPRRALQIKQAYLRKVEFELRDAMQFDEVAGHAVGELEKGYDIKKLLDARYQALVKEK